MNTFKLFEKHKKNIEKSYFISKNRHGDVITNISSIVSKNGIGTLYYRNHDISLYLKKNEKEGLLFEKIMFLLLFGVSPRKGDLVQYTEYLNNLRHSCFKSLKKSDFFSNNMLVNVEYSILKLYEIDENAEDNSFENVFIQCNNLIPSIQVYVLSLYNQLMNKKIKLVLPNNIISTSEFILYMIKGANNYTDLEVRILDIMLFLHAEHGGGNNSTYTNYVVTTSGTDTYSSMLASIASLKGNKHGGASIKTIEMIDSFKEKYNDWNEKNIEKYLADIINKREFDKSGLIYGIGHSMYAGTDPRTVIIKEQLLKLIEINNKEKEFELYCNFENIAKKLLSKKKNNSKNICTNIDFYSGLVYSLIGIPKELLTTIFALSRIVGWSAHRLEVIANKHKLVRPKF